MDITNPTRPTPLKALDKLALSILAYADFVESERTEKSMTTDEVAKLLKGIVDDIRNCISPNVLDAPTDNDPLFEEHKKQGCIESTDPLLKDAIQHCLDVANSKCNASCSREHYRLAHWLIELAQLRETVDKNKGKEIPPHDKPTAFVPRFTSPPPSENEKRLRTLQFELDEVNAKIRREKGHFPYHKEPYDSEKEVSMYECEIQYQRLLKERKHIFETRRARKEDFWVKMGEVTKDIIHWKKLLVEAQNRFKALKIIRNGKIAERQTLITKIIMEKEKAKGYIPVLIKHLTSLPLHQKTN